MRCLLENVCQVYRGLCAEVIPQHTTVDRDQAQTHSRRAHSMKCCACVYIILVLHEMFHCKICMVVMNLEDAGFYRAAEGMRCASLLKINTIHGLSSNM
jgi:hypothetical protein